MNYFNLRFAWRFFNIGWKILLALSVLGMGAISFFSEKVEYFSFGYEIGFFFTPIFSSLIVSIPIYFFISHYSELKLKLESIEKFEVFRGDVVKFLKFFHSISGTKETPKFNEINLSEKYRLTVEETVYEKTFYTEVVKDERGFNDLIDMYLAIILMSLKSKSIENISDGLFKLIVYTKAIFEMAEKNAIVNDIFHNFILVLEKVNSRIFEDEMYAFFLEKKLNLSKKDEILEHNIEVIIK